METWKHGNRDSSGVTGEEKDSWGGRRDYAENVLDLKREVYTLRSQLAVALDSARRAASRGKNEGNQPKPQLDLTREHESEIKELETAVRTYEFQYSQLTLEKERLEAKVHSLETQHFRCSSQSKNGRTDSRTDLAEMERVKKENSALKTELTELKEARERRTAKESYWTEKNREMQGLISELSQQKADLEHQNGVLLQIISDLTTKSRPNQPQTQR